jgi:hypothetical protein
MDKIQYVKKIKKHLFLKGLEKFLKRARSIFCEIDLFGRNVDFYKMLTTFIKMILQPKILNHKFSY